jgi:hypothetical protein
MRRGLPRRWRIHGFFDTSLRKIVKAHLIVPSSGHRLAVGLDGFFLSFLLRGASHELQ